MADRRPPGARDLRHVRRRVPRSPEPAPDPDARGLRGIPAATRLPDRGRTRHLHPRRAQMAGGARVSDGNGDQGISEYRRREQSVTLEQLERPLDVPGIETTEELLTLNFGPHHPATHGVLRLLVTLQSEIVRDIKPVI